MSHPNRSMLVGIILTIVLYMVAEMSRAQTVFFDNLSATDGGVTTAEDDYWLAALFTTDGSTYSSLTATLLLAEYSAGTAELELYTDEDGDGIVPSEFVASFTSPSSYSSSLAETGFTLTGVSLTANTNYWIVLHAESGSYDWAWREDWDGDEDLQAWADSDDDGVTWYGSDAFPFLYSVESGVATTAGDFDEDGDVDGADFLAWQRGYGTFDADDLADWQANYGISALTEAVAVTSVPEPASAFLAGAALLTMILRRPVR